MKKVGLVIPCYNEQDRLSYEVFNSFLEQHPQFIFLFVNDGSLDQTKSILDKFSQQNSRIHFLSLAKNRGKAEAVRQGMQNLLGRNSFSYVGYWDADLSAPFEECLRMIQYFEQNSRLKMIFGSRFKKLGNTIERLWTRHVLGRIFATTVSRMLNMAVYDSQCGAKLIKAEVASQIFNKPFVSRWFFDVEILWRFKLLGYSIDEIFEMPVKKWVHKPGSKLKWTDYVLTFWDLNRIRMKYRKLNPPP